MGEVYRADDLKLGQPVALKFLPDSVARDPARLERFYAEVRIARQVSHPNVCRVYDVGEVEGHTSSRWSTWTARTWPRCCAASAGCPPTRRSRSRAQLCAGLAAAHDKGVAAPRPEAGQRDARRPRPGRGSPTSASPASPSESRRDVLGHAGLHGARAARRRRGRRVRSDIYALGLVLYELFTGRRAFDGATLAELIGASTPSEPPTAPSTIVAATSTRRSSA